ncbi:restriction endonuclease subunit S, partial [Oenococcus sicerae]|uniref:restriction endonuclease subunit S n=1 Tax=Oenococcus sicerae TaxID=2203724 RepID=UPI0039ED4B20
NIPELRFQGFSDPWEKRKLGDLLSYEQPTNYIVESTDYNENFDTPVLTAGQSFILGYTNETEGIKKASSDYPTIIFDDFTTGSHYVDFPFKVKSSAIKMLSTKSERNNIYFAYNILCNINYQPINHERHWISQFSKFDVKVPETIEQNKIGSFFQSLDTLITVNQRKLEELKKLKKAYLQKMFPQNGSEFPELRFTGYTTPWEKRKFDKIVTRISKSTADIDLPRIEYADLISSEGRLNNDIFSKTDHRKGTEFESNDVLFGKLRPYLNNWFFPSFKGVALGDFWVLRATEDMSPIFVFSIIQNTKYQTVANLSAGTKMPRSDWKKVSSTYFFIPKLTEQTKIGQFFQSIDNLITVNQQKLDKLKELKKSYLQKMFV